MEGPAFLHLKHYAFNIILQQHGLQGFISFMAITARASANWSGPCDCGGRVGWVAEWQLDKQRSPRSPALGPVLLLSPTAAAVPSMRSLQECGGPWLANLLQWLEEGGHARGAGIMQGGQEVTLVRYRQMQKKCPTFKDVLYKTHVIHL